MSISTTDYQILQRQYTIAESSDKATAIDIFPEPANFHDLCIFLDLT